MRRRGFRIAGCEVYARAWALYDGDTIEVRGNGPFVSQKKRATDPRRSRVSAGHPAKRRT
jgi:hypothetical protein